MSRNHLRSPLARRLKGLHKRRRRRKEHWTYPTGEQGSGGGWAATTTHSSFGWLCFYFCHYATWNNCESFVLYVSWECRLSLSLVLPFFYSTRMIVWFAAPAFTRVILPGCRKKRRKKKYLWRLTTLVKKNIVWPLIPHRAFWIRGGLQRPDKDGAWHFLFHVMIF